MTEKKKILFITSSSSIGWAFDNEIELLGDNYECHKVSSLIKAQEILKSGVDKVVMYPFYIICGDYKFSGYVREDLRCFAGYHFWGQELEEKKIPTIVVNLQMQVDSYMQGIKAYLWHEEPNVIFFEHNGLWETAEKLAALIKS